MNYLAEFLLGFLLQFLHQILTQFNIEFFLRFNPQFFHEFVEVCRSFFFLEFLSKFSSGINPKFASRVPRFQAGTLRRFCRTKVSRQILYVVPLEISFKVIQSSLRNTLYFHPRFLSNSFSEMSQFFSEFLPNFLSLFLQLFFWKFLARISSDIYLHGISVALRVIMGKTLKDRTVTVRNIGNNYGDKPRKKKPTLIAESSMSNINNNFIFFTIHMTSSRLLYKLVMFDDMISSKPIGCSCS